MAKVIDARYHSSWDGGYDIETACKVNLKTHEIFDIEQANVEGLNLEVLEKEWVEIEGVAYLVHLKSELEEGSNSYWREN